MEGEGEILSSERLIWTQPLVWSIHFYSPQAAIIEVHWTGSRPHPLYALQVKWMHPFPSPDPQEIWDPGRENS